MTHYGPFRPMVDLIPEATYPTDLPKGECALVKIEHFEIDEDKARFHNLRQMIHRRPGFSVRPGKYCALKVMTDYYTETVMMSDVQMEQLSNVEFVRRAHGRVFIAGLGIGMIIVPLLERDDVKEIVVMEKTQEVIDMVAPHLQKLRGGDKLKVVCGDVLTARPREHGKFNVIYFDIWPYISQDNLPEIANLHQDWKFQLDRTDRNCWMSSWMVDHLRQERRTKNARTF